MTAPLFYVESLPDTGTVALSDDDARHAVSALRLREGEAVRLADGRGRVAGCTISLADRSGVQVCIVRCWTVPRPRELRVVQAVPKGERGDLAVEVLTETGASTIVPWTSARTVADWRGKEQAKLQRWQRVARAAAMQTRRAHPPQVLPLQAGIPDVVGQALVLHEEAQSTLFGMDLPAGPVTVVVGPEGGLTEDETTALRDAGAWLVSLGPDIMRTSTAGAAACVWIRGFEKRMGA